MIEAWRVFQRRRNALRFFPSPIEQIAGRVQDAGFSLQDGAQPAASLRRRAETLVWEGARIGTPPFGQITLDLDGFERLTRVRCWDRRPVANLLSSLITAHIATHRSSLGDPLFWSLALQALGRVGAPYLVVGDSHSLCSCSVGGSKRRPTIPIHVLCTAGSAAGLANLASRSGYSLELSGLASALQLCNGDSKVPILFQFGQVDVEFVSVYQRVARSETIFDRGRFEAFCEKAADAYTSFLAATFSKAGTLYVLSIFPPALADEAWAEGYNNAHVTLLESDEHAEEIAARIRLLAIPNLAERTALHRHFNARLAALCGARHLTFVDLFDRFIGPDGTIAARFHRFSGGRDHHINTTAARRVIRPVVERIAERAKG